MRKIEFECLKCGRIFDYYGMDDAGTTRVVTENKETVGVWADIISNKMFFTCNICRPPKKKENFYG